MKKFVAFLLGFSALAVTAQKNPCNPSGLPYTKIPGDTTITLPRGTQITFNRCEFFDLRDCLEFDEMFDMESIEQRGFTTQDRDGNLLLSCGMLRIRLTNECSGKTCFDVPVKIRMPYRPNLSLGGADSCSRCSTGGTRLFTSISGNWSDTTKTESKIIEADGQKYFEFYATCANIAYNCDCKIPGAIKVKFKSRQMKNLEELRLKATCPVAIVKFNPKKPGKKIVIKLPCIKEDELFISARGTGPSGETIIMDMKLLNQLEHGIATKNCKTKKGKVIRRILGIFPVREGRYYKKYFVS